MDTEIGRELISAHTRNSFRDYLVERSVLRTIHQYFDNARIRYDGNYEPHVAGERRTLVEQYYATLDFSSKSDVDKLLHAYKYILIDAQPSDDRDRLIWLLSEDGYEFTGSSLEPRIVTIQGLDEISEIASRFDMPHLQAQIMRIQDSVDDDPDLAIGTAKELLETCCKTILQERGIAYTKNDDLSSLIRLVQSVLDLLPHGSPNQPEGGKTVQRLLGNLGGIVRSTNELRNAYGTGHGKSGRTTGLQPRHARLAVGAASTLATFLWESHKS
jgi:hypothetical protein